MNQIKQKLIYLLTLLFITSFLTSCSEDKEEVLKDEIVSDEVVKSDISNKTGTTYVTAYTHILNKNEFVETGSHAGVRLKLIMQGDSNLVLYSIKTGNLAPTYANINPIWASNTYFANESKTNPRFIAQNDGNAVVYRNSPFSTPVYASNSVVNYHCQNPQVEVEIRRITYLLKPAKYFARCTIINGDHRIKTFVDVDITNLFG